MTQLTAPLHSATNGGLPVAFAGPVEEASGVSGVPKFPRARHVSGDYADTGVALYDVLGNALLVKDDTGFVVGTNSVLPVGFLADETASDQLDEGDMGAARMTLSRILRVVLSTAAGADATASALIAGSAIIGKVGIDQTTDGTTNLVAAKQSGSFNVGGVTTAITATPTVSTSPAYTAADALGGKITLASAVRVSGGGGIIQALTLADKGKQSAAIDVVFFNADPSGTTFTDNGALTIADADLLAIIGVVSIAATDYSAFADNSIATKYGLGLAFKAVGSTSIYACLVNRGTPTYTSTTDIQLAVKILQD